MVWKFKGKRQVFVSQTRYRRPVLLVKKIQLHAACRDSLVIKNKIQYYAVLYHKFMTISIDKTL